MRHKSGLLLVLFLGIILSVQDVALAQIRINSPYTRYGLGQLSSTTSPQILGMGGVTTAISSRRYINSANPASYWAIDSMTFLFDAGLIDQSIDLEVDGGTTSSNYISLSHLLFAFPVNNWWKSSFGLLPVSDVGYIYSLYSELEDIGPVNFAFDGYGGINQFYWGNSFNLFPDLTFGVNMAYLFGSINHNRSAYLPDTALYYNFKITEQTIFKDLYFTFGLQYHKSLKNDMFFNAGLTFNNASKVNADYNYLGETFLEGSNGIQYIKDTVNHTFIKNGKITFPYRMGTGIAFGKTGKWLVSSDFQWENWEKYSSFGKKDSLQDSYQIAIGGEYRPDNASLAKYWKSVTYRLGFRYNKSYLQLRNNDINEFGISFGLTLPLKRSKTTISLGLEAGGRGTMVDDLVRENFIRFAFGVSVNERWFVKRKYD